MPPDLVMAFTCTPDERPCVASKRFEMNWNSAIASLLYLDWFPVPRFDVTCRPSTLSWNSRTSPRSWTGVTPCALVRLPGASSASDIQLRPCDGSSVTCRGSMLDPRLEVVVSMSGACAVTVSDSATPPVAIWRLMVLVCPTRISTPSRVTVLKPERVAVIL